jgi:hypothetical protein
VNYFIVIECNYSALDLMMSPLFVRFGFDPALESDPSSVAGRPRGRVSRLGSCGDAIPAQIPCARDGRPSLHCLRTGLMYGTKLIDNREGEAGGSICLEQIFNPQQARLVYCVILRTRS